MQAINRHNCLSCAVKHLASAAAIAREMITGYDTADYRLYLVGNLNEAQEQLTGIDPEMANLVRQVRLWVAPDRLEIAMTPEKLQAIETLGRVAAKRNPAGGTAVPAKEGKGAAALQPPPCRCSGAAAASSAEPWKQPGRKFQPGPRPVPGSIDIIIPLRADGSAQANDELRIALRSIEKHLRNYRDIYLVSSREPAGFSGFRFVRCADQYPRKQMNIHAAICAALRTPGISNEVIFWADDNVLLADLDAADLPVAVRPDDLLNFSNAPDARVWHRSLRNTGEALRRAGYPSVNYEAHTPVRFQREKYLALESEFNFFEEVGLCYISLYLNRYGVINPLPMRQIKATFESPKVDPKALDGKLFAGFSDGGVEGGILSVLRARFPRRSRFERYGVNRKLYSAQTRIGVVIGTCGSAPHVDLGLHWVVRGNDLPALVVDDCSGDPELARICSGYGAELRELSEHFGHYAGDLQIFAAGLEWAREQGIELLVKLSRRFIACTRWREGLLELACESNAVTFSSYTTSYHYGFRTECLGLYVPAWAPLVPELKCEATPGRRIFVEKFLHDRARTLAESWLSPEFEAWRTAHPLGRDKQGYACWEAMLGTDRRAHREGFLWHNADSAERYAAAARAAGLPYSEEDFGLVRKPGRVQP